MGDTKVILIAEEPRSNTQLIEVPVNTGQSKVPFPDIDNLKNDSEQTIIIKGLRLITPDVSVGGVLNPDPNATLAELQKLFLVLYVNGWEKAEYIPLLTLNDVATPAGTFPYRYAATKFDNYTKVSWTKSYLQFANGTVAAGGPYLVLFDCDYQKLNAQNVPIEGVS